MSRFFGKLHRDMNRVNVFAINRCINEGYGLIRIFIEQIQISLTKLWRVWTFSETVDNRDFTVCIMRCVYRAELILGR